jgi:hypothetical protein
MAEVSEHQQELAEKALEVRLRQVRARQLANLERRLRHYADKVSLRVRKVGIDEHSGNPLYQLERRIGTALSGRPMDAAEVLDELRARRS